MGDNLLQDKKRRRLPDWIKVKVNTGTNRSELNKVLRERGLHTVCEEAKCPNLAECWHKGTATFMLMGSDCTRACRFCAIGYDKPKALDEQEPQKVAESAALRNLSYVVVTSVARDDLPDEGAEHFAQTIREIRSRLPKSGIEVLTPDFNGRLDCLQTVWDAKPTVFNHNLETCRRLSGPIRGRAKYERSLLVLKEAKNRSHCLVKSGIMVGMGETDEEVLESIRDLYEHGVGILTIGQYLAPSTKHWKVDRYVHPDKFLEWEEYAKDLGFFAVASGPMVRSSYRAGDLVQKHLDKMKEL